MKRFNLDIFLRRSKLCWKKTQPKTISLRANILIGNAVKQPPLGSLLGTSGINAEQFCESFNTKTLSIFNWTLIIPVIIKITPTKSFSFIIKKPTTNILIIKLILISAIIKIKKQKKKYKHILAAVFYKIAILKTGSLKYNKYKNFILSIIGSMDSGDIYAIEDKSSNKYNYNKRRN